MEVVASIALKLPYGVDCTEMVTKPHRTVHDNILAPRKCTDLLFNSLMYATSLGSFFPIWELGSEENLLRCLGASEG